MTNIAVGYQGIPFSNSHKAAQQMVARQGWDNVDLVPLTTSQRVADALVQGEIRCGVIAVRNKLAGPVGETEAAFAPLHLRVLLETDMPIHHCLFLRPGTRLEEITAAASHIQALHQCAGNLERLLPGAMLQELEDTAVGARYLAEGKLPATTAVLCRKEAGEHYALTLAAENIEDSGDNITTFHLVELEQ